VAGSNPNSDVNTTAPYPTEYRIERFYPSYYNQRRPEPQGLPNQLSYGGSYFNVSLTLADLFGNVDSIQTAKVIIMRTGFSTHTMVCPTQLLKYINDYLSATEHGDALGTTTELLYRK
jgi:hypothetical protein